MNPHIGAVVSGVNLREPLSEEQIALLYDALVRRKVLVLHGQFLNHAMQARFARQLSTVSSEVLRPGLFGGRHCDMLSQSPWPS